ncbi:uncharacterized protein LOC133186701 [Saccostrea echinata]|uniref:uncharacterized protein LOC133186701 n=1 Tax=Saccostrea echinata TaxID=191078 RepID=UPI002A827FFF|nr:uncharacterized protein LOC133186701 [Saccostrea echinata]
MARNITYFIVGILLMKKHNGQLCNLGMHHRRDTSLSSIYVYYDLPGVPHLTAEKALDGKYYNHPHECAGSDVRQVISEAWWQVTFKSTANIFKINLVFRELFIRHAGYYVFITNRTLTYSELTSFDPVYHDEEPSPSQQMTIIFPEGHAGVQVFLYVNKSNPSTTNYAVIEPCEVEIYGCVEENLDGCACANMTADGKDLDLWEFTPVFSTKSIALRCNDNFLSIMNMSQFDSSQFISVLSRCDGTKQCSFNSSLSLKDKTFSFMCSDKCINENYTNAILKHNLVQNLQYESDDRDSFTALLKSRVFECEERHVLTKGNLTIQCEREGRWSEEAPVCNVTCQEPFHENITTIRDTSPYPVYFEDYNVSYSCRQNHRHVGGNLSRVCNGSGDWSGEEPICKRCKCPCNRVRSQNFIKDPEVLKKRLNEMKKELEVNQNELSATVRAKTSAKDERKSAKGMGSVLGVGIISFVLMTLVCSDLPLLYRQIRYGPLTTLLL